MNTHTSEIRRQILVAMLAALAAGCAGGKTQESTGEYIDDSTITTKVKTVMLKDPAVSSLVINVETYKGTVQLSGFARSEQERTRAVGLAQSVDGVKSVRNDIVIR
ncbi:MAG TPA: BON domain-containing protein [Burkholderiales bacterium]